MNDNTVLQFTSKDCKNNVHSNCHSSWTGLGFNIICSCICHGQKSAASLIKNKTCTGLSIGNNREEMTLEQHVVEPACSNPSSQNQSSQQHEVAVR
jgi:hypothetical protein